MSNEHKFAALSFTVALALAGVVALLWLLDGSRVALAQSGTGVIRVATTGNDTPGCGNPITPCLTVQYAVDQAQAGEEIRVAAGTYTDIHVRASITQVVYISKTVTIRGGYTTAFIDPPDPETNQTTLDAQGQGRVFFISGDISPTIEGLRITGGDAEGLGGLSWGDAGGGVYIRIAMSTIRSSQVFSNTAEYGGGLYLWSSGVLSGNTVTSNTADFHGGGVFLYYSDATLSGNTIISNTVGDRGGGLHLYYSSDATLSGNTISDNSAEDGGGLYLLSSGATLRDNTISDNNASSVGGGLRLSGSGAILSGNKLISNTADGDGGGLYLINSSAVTLTNNVVADNRAKVAGSGLYILASSPQLLHTTIARNSDGYGRGVDVQGGSTVSLTNTILVSHPVGINVTAGNTATLESTLWYSNTTADWGGVGYIFTGTHNYWGDPLFDADGYHLMANSAAIDKGMDAGVTTDIDGDSRDSAPDLGADERAGIDIYLPIIMKNASP